ncbi:hypothetical protein BJ983_000636 [Actinomycetospora corticicola]|uniref:Uncharacterized protein n=1 Tax=Actinomycetospora corticicola TaxID=663602 RepID=A0A7Y9DSB0_9PSEU|nr:hypothetical protein [Actinomycetospora corticicola]
MASEQGPVASARKERPASIPRPGSDPPLIGGEENDAEEYRLLHEAAGSPLAARRCPTIPDLRPNRPMWSRELSANRYPRRSRTVPTAGCTEDPWGGEERVAAAPRRGSPAVCAGRSCRVVASTPTGPPPTRRPRPPTSRGSPSPSPPGPVVESHRRESSREDTVERCVARILHNSMTNAGAHSSWVTRCVHRRTVCARPPSICTRIASARCREILLDDLLREWRNNSPRSFHPDDRERKSLTASVGHRDRAFGCEGYG